ncbi:MAG: hypothetical protein NWE86_01445, partial [Candidatus Bathyarchaeota archaeon]|nr:hypothetical protein [Candidatus Bathyarchaeota archaeon]
MIIPVKKVSLVTITDNESSMLEGLGKLGVVQLKKLDEAEFIGFEKVIIEETREYENLKERFQILYGKFGDIISVQEEQMELDREIIPEKELSKCLEEFELRTTNIESQLREVTDYHKDLNDAKPSLQILRDQEINPGDLGDLKNLFVNAGIANNKLLPRFERIVRGRKDVTFKSSPISENEV